MSTALLLYNPIGGAYYRSLTGVALLIRGIWEQPLWSVQYALACYRLVSFTAYYVLVVRLSAVHVMFSEQLLAVVFDLAYDLSSEYTQLYRIGLLHYNKQYSI